MADGIYLGVWRVKDGRTDMARSEWLFLQLLFANDPESWYVCVSGHLAVMDDMIAGR